MRDRLASVGAPEWVLVLWDIVEAVGAATTLVAIYKWLQSQHDQLEAQPA